MSSVLLAAYDRTILVHPLLTLLLIACIVAGLATNASNFRLDASADSLVLEQDESLDYYRAVKARYGSDDSLIITYTPKAELFSDEVLEDIRQLRSKLKKVSRVESVTTLLDVPLIKSPPVTLFELSQEVITLESTTADPELAQQEILSSPLYRDLLVSKDGTTTTLQVFFEYDQIY